MDITWSDLGLGGIDVVWIIETCSNFHVRIWEIDWRLGLALWNLENLSLRFEIFLSEV